MYAKTEPLFSINFLSATVPAIGVTTTAKCLLVSPESLPILPNAEAVPMFVDEGPLAEPSGVIPFLPPQVPIAAFVAPLAFVPSQTSESTPCVVLQVLLPVDPLMVLDTVNELVVDASAKTMVVDSTEEIVVARRKAPKPPSDSAEDRVMKSLTRMFKRLLLSEPAQPSPAPAPTVRARKACARAVVKPEDVEMKDARVEPARRRLTRWDVSPEVQRATAEVWGATLRQLKTSAREQCVGLFTAGEDDELTDACAWMLVSAFRRALPPYTAAASLFAPLLGFHLGCGAPEASHTLIRRVMTALAHHCQNAGQFAPVADGVVAEFVECAQAPGEEERLRRMLEIAATLAAKHLSTPLAQFPALPRTDALHAALLKFAASVLTAGDMALWMGEGRRAVEYAWERWAPSCAGRCRTLPGLLESHPQKMLRLLVALHRQQRLAEVDAVWKQPFQAWVDGHFWELSTQTTTFCC
ncbi:hypothetical protein B0H21DRAFT_851327 [Amylocystis lapponica]|nr:hypothetical protein B0H21DRAFT_851327 [Amylocystis lapponica]